MASDRRTIKARYFTYNVQGLRPITSLANLCARYGQTQRIIAWITSLDINNIMPGHNVCLYVKNARKKE